MIVLTVSMTVRQIVMEDGRKTGSAPPTQTVRPHAPGELCRDHYTDDAATVTPTVSWPIWIAVESALVILSMGGQRVDLAFEQGAVEGLTAREVKVTSATSLIAG